VELQICNKGKKNKRQNESLKVSCTLKMEKTKVDKKIKFPLVQFRKEIINKRKIYFNVNVLSTKYLYVVTFLFYQHLALAKHVEIFCLFVLS
jgi:hypothetical protein